MPLKITRAIDPITVDHVVVCLYAVPGIGKTSTGYTASKPLLLDFDHGAYRSKNRRDTVLVDNWASVQDITAADLDAFDTVVVDTAGRALDALSTKIIADDPKMGRGGALTLQGYGRLKSDFIAWTKMLRSMGKDVVLLCHSDEQKSGDDLIERLDMQGGSKNEVYKSSDVMGRLYLHRGKRTLNFSPTDTSFGKNPAGMAPLEVPDFAKEPDFLAKVMAEVKAKLNELTAEQTAVAQAMDIYKTSFDAATTAEELTGLISLAKEAPEAIRRNVGLLLTHIAKGKGFALNKEAGRYETAEPAVASCSD